jgi:anti-sigma factor RsiW
MKACERNLEDLALLLADEIDPERRAALESHLGSCAACARESAAFDRAFADLRASDAPDPGPVYWSSFQGRFRGRLAARRAVGRRHLLYAAAAVLVAATGLGILIGRRPGAGDAGGAAPAVATSAGVEGDRAEARLEAALHAVRARASGDAEFEAILDEIAPGDPYAFTGVALPDPERNSGV